MKLNKEATELFGKGFLEDLIPFMIKLCPTKRYKTVIGMMDQLTDMFRRKFREHEESFDPGMFEEEAVERFEDIKGVDRSRNSILI